MANTYVKIIEELESMKLSDAREQQNRVAQESESSALPLKNPDLIAGADASLKRGDEHIYGAIVVWSRSKNKIVDASCAMRKVRFPYIPGYLSYREAPVLLDAWAQLKTKPDALICDGQGIAHPRRAGIAVHMGWILKIPTVGCAKSRLTGTYEDPENTPGANSTLYADDQPIGHALRSRKNSKVLFISPGWGINQADSLHLIMECLRGYRLPEPTRNAHNIVGQFRKTKKRPVIET